jgi:hypothetical protein
MSPEKNRLEQAIETILEEHKDWISFAEEVIETQIIDLRESLKNRGISTSSASAIKGTMGSIDLPPNSNKEECQYFEYMRSFLDTSRNSSGKVDLGFFFEEDSKGIILDCNGKILVIGQAPAGRRLIGSNRSYDRLAEMSDFDKFRLASNILDSLKTKFIAHAQANLTL